MPNDKYEGDWDFEVRDGAFHHQAGEALVFAVRPRKILVFAKGNFAQTRFDSTGPPEHHGSHPLGARRDESSSVTR